MIFHSLPYLSFAALMVVYLGFITAMDRRRTRTPIGLGTDDLLARKSRAHGNFCEYSTLFLILLVAYEMTNGSSYIVHALGITFFTGRVLHAYGLIVDEPRNMPFKNGLKDFIFRIRGMQITFFCLIALALLLLWHYLGTFILVWNPNL